MLPKARMATFLPWRLDFALADRYGIKCLCRESCRMPLPRGIAHCRRSVDAVGGGEHAAAFGFVGRGHDHHVRQAGQEGQIESTVVGAAVGTDQAAAVNGQHHRQVLQGDVVDQLIVGALQEGRIDRNDGFQAFTGEACAKGQRMLLGNADIEVAVRVFGGEAHQARAFAHGRSDAHQSASRWRPCRTASR